MPKATGQLSPLNTHPTGTDSQSIPDHPIVHSDGLHDVSRFSILSSVDQMMVHIVSQARETTVALVDVFPQQDW